MLGMKPPFACAGRQGVLLVHSRAGAAGKGAPLVANDDFAQALFLATMLVIDIA